jgi:hypothetical protein
MRDNVRVRVKSITSIDCTSTLLKFAALVVERRSESYIDGSSEGTLGAIGLERTVTEPDYLNKCLRSARRLRT